jgi:hypothetical protein
MRRALPTRWGGRPTVSLRERTHALERGGASGTHLPARPGPRAAAERQSGRPSSAQHPLAPNGTKDCAVLAHSGVAWEWS